MHQKKKLAILIEVDSFIGDIYHHLSKTYEVLAIQPKTYKEIETAVEWADIVWFEFCNELFAHAINQNIRRLGKRVIARWHRFEIVESSFPTRINFGFIDDLILVSHDMLRVLRHRVPQLSQKTRTHVVWNGLNLEKFKPIPSLDKKKIVWAAKPFMRKNQPMFLQIMHALVKRDPSYTLHVAGEQEEFVMAPYLQRTTEKLGLARTFGILREQHPNMRKLLRCEPNAFGDRNAWFLRGGWCAVHAYFFAVINRTAKSAPTELSTEARSPFTRK